MKTNGLPDQLIAIRAMFDTLNAYAHHVNGQSDLEFDFDTIEGIGRAGYELADRAWDEAIEATRK